MRFASWGRRRRIVVAGAALAGLAGAVVATTLDRGAEEPAPAATGTVALEELPALLAVGGRGDGPCGRLVYRGEGEPNVALVVGATARHRSGDAVELVLERRDWRAGPWRVGMYVCDEGGATGAVSFECSRIAQQVARWAGVVAVVGPATPGCAQIVSEQGGGRTAAVSGTVTHPCLTRRGPQCERSEPARYAPAGHRTFARVVAHEAAQAAAFAELAAGEGLRRVVVLDDREGYGLALADAFRRAAPAVGVEVVGHLEWDPRSRRYDGLMGEIAAMRPNAVLLAGLLDENGARVVRDKVRLLGPNDGRIRLLASDGFFTPATFAEAGEAAQGMLAAAPGLAPDRLPQRGRELAATLAERALARWEGELVRLVQTAQAAEVVLDAIARSDGTRASVLAALPTTRVEDGLIGSFAFDEHGDATLRWVTVYRAEAGRFVPHRAIDPDRALVDEALG